jgi:tetratricopeptide (TPR) repeat protein
MLKVCKVVGLGLVAGLVCSCAAQTAEGGGAHRRSYSMSQEVVHDLAEISDLLERKNWDAALSGIDKASKRKRLNPLERASLLGLRASAHAALQKFDEMTKDLEQAVALDALPEEQQLKTMFGLGQTYFMAERFNDSADVFGKWAQRTKSAEPSDYFLVASTYAQAKRFAEALPFAKKAVETSKQPEEPWLKLLVQLHYELKQDAEVAAVLERLTVSFPKSEEYWLHLAQTYQDMKQSAKALSTLENANTQGVLTEESAFVSLAKLYLQQGAPLKGAAVLDAQLRSGKVSKKPENLALLTICWVKGKDAEHAEATLKALGDNEISGDVYYELGRLEVERGQWAHARDNLASALQSGGLKSAGRAHLLLGIAHYNTKRKDAALASLGEAKKYSGDAKCAEEWIGLVKAGRPSPTTSCATSASPDPGAGH